MADPRSPKSPRKGKVVSLRVTFLNDSVHAFQIPMKAVGIALWEAVINHLQLLEVDYFGLEYTNHNGDECWLDMEKQIVKQLPSADTPLRFGVKFYTPDPSLLQDELTRYFFALQVRRDLFSGELHCSENTAALLASYIAQAEIGDYLVDEYVDCSYLSSFKFVPQRQQTTELLQKVMDYHKQHIGESPSEADSNLLDVARKVEMYGIKFHPAKDHENVALNLAIAHMGVLVFQGLTKINTFSWAKVRKLSFKRKKFLIKLHPESYGYYKDTVEFFFDSRDRCKYFWKKCIEHHTFFRCQTIKKLPRNKARVVSRGSSFRYSGRTQKELQEFVRDNLVRRPQFERSTSGRISTSRSTSVTPKISSKPSVHNSSDLHNSTASSGSHILEISTAGLPSLPSTRLETAEVHSDSSMSGSRSLGSPRLEHGLSGDSEGGDFMSQPVDMAAVDARLPHADSSGVPHANNIHESTSPRSPSGLNAKDRKFSAPVFSSMGDRPNLEEHRLSRSAEVENIPEIVDEEKKDHDSISSPNRRSLIRSTSAAESDIHRRSYDDLPPPPPSPPKGDEEEEREEENGDRTQENEDDDEVHRMYLVSPGRNPAANISSSSIGFSSNMSTLSSGMEVEEESKKKSKHRPTDAGYYILKELLMTERTYKKDLEVLCVWFRSAVSGDSEMLSTMTDLVFSHLDPIYTFHCHLLKEIDQRLTLWEGKSTQMENNCRRIGDIMLSAADNLRQLYQNFLGSQENILLKLHNLVKQNKSFEDAYKEFESQKVCYLPLNTFFLKPGQRLLHYKLILERLLKHYPYKHSDAADCQVAYNKIKDITDEYKDTIRQLENLQKLMELQQDLIGLENLVSPKREFQREGCLQKYSRKGYQQRMFFLFSDMLVYTSRAASSVLQFKVHGQLPTRGMSIEESEQSKVAVPNTFAIYANGRAILVAASSQEEKNKWIEDINHAAQIAAQTPEMERPQYPSLRSSTGSQENIEMTDSNESHQNQASEKPIQHRANTTMHVCWHRNTSVSIHDHDRALRNQLSGYLLRKFKTSNGWQKLWVVFTNFCLFFYKTYQDDFPLASLPLLGYAVSQPEPADCINKEHVFKLQFKNHVYYFRAESEYTYSRWMEVINLATSSARRTRLFSRMTSQLDS